MKQSLINLKDKLENAGFRFEASTSVYNPMERFADYVSTKEIVHSKIIADLLNPKGEHQLGYGFLVMFLQTIGIGVKRNIHLLLRILFAMFLSKLNLLLPLQI